MGMGSRSSTTQVRKRDPESPELKNMRTSIYNMLAPITGAAPMDMVVPPVGGMSAGSSVDAAVSRGKPSRSSEKGLPQGYELDGMGTKWGDTAFGSDWLANRARTADALNQYDSLSQNVQPLMGKVTGTADKISGLTDRMSGLSGDMGNLAGKIEGVGDRQNDLSSEILDFTRTGNVPGAVLDNLNRAVNSELGKNTGSALNDLASRGVMNSSVANRSLGALADSAADAYAKNYLNAFNSVLSGYGQTNSTLSGAGNTYAKAIAGRNDALAGLNSAVNGLNSAMGGYGKALTTNADLMKQAAAMPSMLSQAMMSQYAPAYQFWKDLQSSYDNREDYDTVIKQGK